MLFFNLEQLGLKEGILKLFFDIPDGGDICFQLSVTMVYSENEEIVKGVSDNMAPMHEQPEEDIAKQEIAQFSFGIN
jgi:hypothetical protein